MNGNREYKSDVFSMLMEDKKRALQLYNVMNNSSHEIKPREKKVPKSPVNLNSEGEKILCVIKSNIFLISVDF